MQRDIFTDEHDAFREVVAGFLDREVVPHHEQWEQDGIVPREVWTAAGKIGLFGFEVPEIYGGGGTRDFRFNAIVTEEISSRNLSGLGFSLQNDVVTPYLVSLTNDEQKQRWLPGLCSGELITAIAMTEPGTGSDLQAIRTSAVRDGGDWVLNGQKTFITNGINADLVIVVARTNAGAGSRGLSLLVVERDMWGFERGRNLDKIGMHGQDTAELSFTDVRIPAANLLGEQDRGFFHLMRNLPAERLSIAIIAVTGARAAVNQTIRYVKDRRAFGSSIANFQNTKFVLAECATEVEMAQTFIDRAILLLNEQKLSATDAAMAKWWCSEMQNRVVARCLQLHGGYGYMNEYPIAKAYADARVTTIYGGTTEIMKEIVGRSLLE
ncbi:acyl-CoA dehydrogenase family protein [Rhodococcus opacus]|uniref:Acyl-CoA dehydrogenase n=1 Tax=Rhodococcus opacus TaxID=37919 RepID=A0A2S8J9X5_RHOOP|nr:acyl-CoA dehydrogenase family protein [Rhodococcus opacus]PQP23432.1 acyl-CoA dehydrogenase [Rhodococcus opacus]